MPAHTHLDMVRRLLRFADDPALPKGDRLGLIDTAKEYLALARSSKGAADLESEIGALDTAIEAVLRNLHRKA